MINASVGWGASYADPTPNGDPGLGDVQQFIDRGNLHVYAYESREVSEDPDTWYLGFARQASGDKPLWATETGYGEANGIPVSDEAHGRYLPRLALEHFNHGVERAYVHELFDVDPGSFGQLRPDGTPKPGFTSSANLAAILADTGGDFTPGALEYAADVPIDDDHDPDTHEPHSTLLQRSDGTFFLILWQDRDSNREVVPDTEVTLTFGTDIAQATTYLPLESTAPQSTVADPTTLTLSVPDHPLVVELRPRGTAAPTPGATAAPVPTEVAPPLPAPADPAGLLERLLAELRSAVGCVFSGCA